MLVTVSKEVETLRKYQKEINAWDQKYRMKNAFYGLTSRLDTALERILKTEDISIVTPQNLKSKENRDWKKEENIQGLWVTTNGVTHM